MRHLTQYLSLLLVVSHALASVTVYYQVPLADQTGTASAATYTGAAAYDPTVLTPPPVPAGFGLSAPLPGSFLGFSIETSVVTQTPSSSFLQVPFLNLMSNIRERAGEVRIRIGGNTQETATLVDSLPGGVIMMKAGIDVNNPTQTPALLYTPELFNLLGNISALVGTKWFLGIPFNDTSNLRLGIAEVGEAVLSPPGYLLGFQVGNEPDLYAYHSHRPANYSPFDYFGEFGIVDNSIPIKNNLVAPSVSGTWTPEDVFNTGFTFSPHTSIITHRYSLVAPYLNASAYAASQGKPFVMMETGFPGLSDSFGAAMWAVDYALQMGVSGFWGAMMHVSGQDVYYNVTPPTNQSSYHQWTTETLGSSRTAQLVDMTNSLASNGVAPVSTSTYTPVYAVYENGQMARLVAFNFVSDSSGASAASLVVAVQGASVASVQVKYLQAPSVSDKYDITWAGQTFGGTFASDGRPMGPLSIQTIACDTTTSTCTIPLPAPCIALIFLTPGAFSESNPTAVETFATTAYTKTVNTATMDPSVLATNNGISGVEREVLASTSNENGAVRVRATIGAVAMLGVVIGMCSLIIARDQVGTR
ncbi:glycoside hydrolase family 79 protein [Melanogaster broomeanus]|nr:glycoside hydrolase family 79 protein [Melanogaster broomeanus]